MQVQVTRGVAEAHGAKASFRWRDVPYIPVINDEGMVALVQTIAQRLAPRATWQLMPEPNMAGEDFAFFAGTPAPPFHRSGQGERLSCSSELGGLDWAEGFLWHLVAAQQHCRDASDGSLAAFRKRQQQQRRPGCRCRTVGA